MVSSSDGVRNDESDDDEDEKKSAGSRLCCCSFSRGLLLFFDRIVSYPRIAGLCRRRFAVKEEEEKEG